jgi:hypothetical protein
MDNLIYAIVSLDENLEIEPILSGINGISGTKLHAVSHPGIAAVYSEISRTELVAGHETAMIYAQVIEQLAQHFTLLPMRFGSFLESGGATTKLLERNHEDFQSNLLKVENRFEFGLKVFCDPSKLAAIVDILAGKSGIIQSIPEPTDSVFKNYMNEKLREHRKEELMLSYVESLIAEIRENLIHINATGKFKKMVTSTIIVDAVFLLRKEKRDDLIVLVKQFQNKYPGLEFIMTGPWPPYSFVDITIK